MVAIQNPTAVGAMPKGEPVPESVYHLRVDKAEFKKTGPNSKHPGSPMAELTFTIFGPDDAEEYHGRKVFENVMLSGEGMFRLRQLLEASGEDEDFVLEDTDQLVGREVAGVVQVEPERRDGEKVYSARNKIHRFLPIA